VFPLEVNPLPSNDKLKGAPEEVVNSIVTSAGGPPSRTGVCNEYRCLPRNAIGLNAIGNLRKIESRLS
jgi:hypothetical protein